MKTRLRKNALKTKNVKTKNFKKGSESDSSEIDEEPNLKELVSETDEESGEEAFFNEKRRKLNKSSLEKFSSADSFLSSEEEVLPITDGQSDEIASEESDGALDDDLPNVEAWGRKKSVYYNADFVDEDRGKTYWEDDEEAAKAEEADALALQKKFLESVDASVFKAFPVAEVKETFEEEKLEEATPDWESISAKEKLKILNKTSPELIPLVSDFKESLYEVKRLIEESKNECTEAYKSFYRLKEQLHLHYCMNIGFYMILKCRCTSVADHPVMKKLALYKAFLSMLDDIESCLDTVPIVDAVQKETSFDVAKNKSVENVESNSKNTQSKRRKKGNILQDTEVEKEIVALFKEAKEKAKREEIGDDDDEISDALENTEEKRTVTYEIAKNKGIVPRRKKEYRNPRVRHRMKYKKAKIRRKGQVREARHEAQRYGGEFSGIHANVTRSIKIK